MAEYQARGLVHFHSVVRVDGPDGPGSTAPGWVTTGLLDLVVRRAAASVLVESWRPTGEVLPLRWGDQVDVQPIRSDDGDATDGKSVGQLAGYIAKYSTKDFGVTEAGVDRPLRSRDHIAHIAASAHHRRMMAAAWDLGGLGMYEGLRLRETAHRLGFRGHFLSKSRQYSVTFTRLRLARQYHRLAELLSSLDVSETDVTVINDWTMTSVGHHSEVERELAAAIGERQRNQRRKE